MRSYKGTLVGGNLECNVDTVFLLAILCIRPFATTSENENEVESKGGITSLHAGILHAGYHGNI